MSDISCDVEGSLEFLTRTTVIERPFYSYLPDRGQDEDVVDGRGIVVSGVDILPSELPREASQTFGDALSPLLPHLASSEGYDPASPPDDLNTDLPPPLQGAVITANGRLTRGYEYISFLRKEKEREKKLRDKVHGGRAIDQQHGGAAGAGQALPLMAMTLHGHLFDSGERRWGRAGGEDRTRRASGGSCDARLEGSLAGLPGVVGVRVRADQQGAGPDRGPRRVLPHLGVHCEAQQGPGQAHVDCGGGGGGPVADGAQGHQRQGQDAHLAARGQTRGSAAQVWRCGLLAYSLLCMSVCGGWGSLRRPA